MRTLGSVLVLGVMIAGCPPSMAGMDANPEGGRDGGTDARDVAVDGTRDATRDGADGTVDVPDAGIDVVDAVDRTAMDAGDAALDGARDAGSDVTMDAGRDAASDVVADARDAGTCTPTVETCNGMDDDCDGTIDESMCTPHLLITEVVVTPTEQEFIEIHNPTASPIDLSNVYVTDFHDYARVIASSSPATVGSADFVARFPAGATIPPGGYQTVATGSPHSFGALFGGACPTYYLPRSGAMLGSCTMSQPMRTVPGVSTSIGSSAGLTNSNEPVVLFQWDGMSDRVQDIDYVYYGMPSTSNPQVNKTGLMVDGPDMDMLPSVYLPDTPPSMQQTAAVHALGGALIRCHFGEGAEVRTGGNGMMGHNETSENFSVTWRVTVPAMSPDGGMLTSVNATPNRENDCR